MKKLAATIVVVILTLSLSTCDIEPVSAGTWDIEIETSAGIESSLWTITADGTVSMTGAEVIVAEGAVLEGSRIAWTGESVNPQDTKQTINANFNGTVDGDRLQGTLFTVLGNMSVSGKRQ